MLRITNLVGLVALSGVFLLSTAGFTAELRSSVGEQTVYRQVAMPEGKSPTLSPYFEPAVHMGGPCDDCGLAGCDHSCLQFCGWWSEVEYLLWWRRGRRFPPLVTSSSNPNSTGTLNDSSVLFGDDRLGEDITAGGRVTLGTWLDAYQCYALEGRFYALGEETIDFEASSDGTTILARPIVSQGETARILASANINTVGNVRIQSRSEVLGGDALLRQFVCEVGPTRIEVLSGYQFARIDEDLQIADSSTRDDGINLVTQSITDRFETRNEFHGGQFGIEATYFGSCWRLELLAKVAVGHVNQRVTVSGLTVNEVPNDPNSPSIVQEGLLANAGNQGTFERNEFAVSPEFGARMYFQLAECLDLSLGYSFLYWDKVVQPGEINEARLVPASFRFADSSYWLHGMNAGLEYRF